MRRLLRRFAFLVFLLLLAAGHVWYWYLPRERAAAPDAADLPARLLVSGDFDTCVWVPFPHQNLGALAAEVEDFPGFVAAAARLAGSEETPRLPGFGPFAVPPAREVAACSDRSGGRFQVAARIYPAIALVAKAAGAVAGNPWLAGGPVPGRPGQPASAMRVEWDGGLWTVTSGRPAAALAAPRGRSAALLGAVRLARPERQVPAGTYLLRRRGDGFALTLAGAPAPPALVLPNSGSEPGPVLVAVAGVEPADAAEPEAGPQPPAALILFRHEAGGHLRLPGAAVLNPPGEARWGLPGGGLADMIAGSLPRGNAAGWEIVAVDGASLRQAERLAAPLARLLFPPSSGPRLSLGLWLEPAPAHALAERISTFLEKVPLVERREARQWRDVETLLAALAACRRLTAAAGTTPPSFALELQGCEGGGKR
ncbi:MAG TPA: hypothetical protein VEG34_19255 [Thermoanaerobaculia bacterium]|nr:hypothetical protein [Thermoanaerobaculia bacterium]